MTRTPLDAFRDAIETWEGGFQNDPDDLGNWANGKLIGTNRGVTPAALARYLQRPLVDVTVDAIKAVTLETAADIGVKHYYDYPCWGYLPWRPATESLVDFGWGAGPRLSIMQMQKMIAVAPDGIIGPITQRAYAEWLRGEGDDGAVWRVRDMRVNFYRHIVDVRPVNKKYLTGWLRRADWYLPDNEKWWSAWNL